MSNTMRDFSAFWGPGDPEFDRLFPHIKTNNKFWKFTARTKNCRYNLLRKNRELQLKERLAD